MGTSMTEMTFYIALLFFSVVISQFSQILLKKSALKEHKGFIQEYVVYCAVSDFKAFYILTAYVDYEINIASEMLCRRIMGDCLNNADVYAEGYLTGVLTTTVVNTGYILQNQGDGPTFYDAEGSSFSLPAGRCYLTPTTPLEAKAFRIIPNDASDIRNIQHTSTATPTDYYDLSGRRIVRPLKGIYLRGNNKVLIP